MNGATVCGSRPAVPDQDLGAIPDRRELMLCDDFAGVLGR
jgi:hypothetical protein